MFSVFATNGEIGRSHEYQTFSEAMRIFARVIDGGRATLVTLSHEHPEYGISDMFTWSCHEGLHMNAAAVSLDAF